MITKEDAATLLAKRGYTGPIADALMGTQDGEFTLQDIKAIQGIIDDHENRKMKKEAREYVTNLLLEQSYLKSDINSILDMEGPKEFYSESDIDRLIKTLNTIERDRAFINWIEFIAKPG